MAQLGTPDMKIPIQYALYYPQRRKLSGERLHFAKLGQITFEDPDLDKFTGLRLALKAANAGGTMPTVFNAANERAVRAFLERKISFNGIADMIACCMQEHHIIEHPNLEQVLDTELETYELIERRWRV